MDAVDIDVDLDVTEVAGVDCVTIALSTPQIYIMVHVPRAEIGRFAEVRGRRWEDGAVGIGSCAGANAFWCDEDGELTLLVGHDHETWTVSFSMPIECLARIERGLAGAHAAA